MWYILGFAVGIVVGLILHFMVPNRQKKQKPSATFVMDFSDPMKDVCRLELEEDINAIYEKDYILVKIERKESQE